MATPAILHLRNDNPNFVMDLGDGISLWIDYTWGQFGYKLMGFTMGISVGIDAGADVVFTNTTSLPDFSMPI